MRTNRDLVSHLTLLHISTTFFSEPVSPESTLPAELKAKII